MKTLAALIAAVALLPQTPPRDNARAAAPDSGTAAIRGRVVASDTGAPIKYAQVMVFRSEPMFSVSATADWLGRFALFDAIYADATEIVINEDERRAVDLRRLTIVK